MFALAYGLGIARGMGVHVRKVRAGRANMFLSDLFAETFSTITGATVELFNTDGSQGAARGAGIGAGFYKSPAEAFAGLKTVKVIEPDANPEPCREAYRRWEGVLERDCLNR